MAIGAVPLFLALVHPVSSPSSREGDFAISINLIVRCSSCRPFSSVLFFWGRFKLHGKAFQYKVISERLVNHHRSACLFCFICCYKLFLLICSFRRSVGIWFSTCECLRMCGWYSKNVAFFFHTYRISSHFSGYLAFWRSANTNTQKKAPTSLYRKCLVNCD